VTSGTGNFSILCPFFCSLEARLKTGYSDRTFLWQWLVAMSIRKVSDQDSDLHGSALKFRCLVWIRFQMLNYGTYGTNFDKKLV
jgi:hypothetical protein